MRGNKEKDVIKLQDIYIYRCNFRRGEKNPRWMARAIGIWDQVCIFKYVYIYIYI